MGASFAVTLQNRIFDATNAEKNEKLLFCVGSAETALRARQGEIFEESASHHVVTTRQWNSQVAPRAWLSRFIDRPTGRTRLISTGEFIPDAERGTEHSAVEEDQRISAVSVGALTSTASEDHYCMLDSGANVMVVPWKEGMKGDQE